MSCLGSCCERGSAARAALCLLSVKRRLRGGSKGCEKSERERAGHSKNAAFQTLRRLPGPAVCWAVSKEESARQFLPKLSCARAGLRPHFPARADINHELLRMAEDEELLHSQARAPKPPACEPPTRYMGWLETC